MSGDESAEDKKPLTAQRAAARGFLLPTGAVLTAMVSYFWHQDQRYEDFSSRFSTHAEERMRAEQDLRERFMRLEGMLMHVEKIDAPSRREFEAASAQTKQALDAIINRLDRMERK